jgi:chromosome partitioning protein
MEPKLSTIDAASFLDISLQALHKRLRASEIPFQKMSNKTYLTHAGSRPLFNLKFNPKIISFQIVKGGTGKTTIAHSVAIRANLYGARVLCIDLDQQGNLTQALNIRADSLPIAVDVLKEKIPFEDTIVNVLEGIDLIPSRIENAILDNILMLERYSLDHVFSAPFSKFRNKYDLIIIDCPPALSQTVTAASLASDLIVAPVVPEEFSLAGLDVTAKELRTIEENFRKRILFKLVVNRFDSRTSLSHEVLSKLIKSNLYSDLLFSTYVRTSQEFPNAIAQGISIFDTLKPSSAKEDIDLLTREILELNQLAVNQAA